MSHRPKRSTVIPLCLLVYLAVMAWVGRARLEAGEYLYYFGVIGGSLLIIALLYWSLRRKEALRDRREEELYGTYSDNDEANSEAEPRTTEQD